jgi:hypothetical protein
MTRYFHYCLTVTVLFLWGAPSDERTGLSFVYAASPCQRSLSRVRVPWDSRPYFSVSDLRLPFSSPPTTRPVIQGYYKWFIRFQNAILSKVFVFESESESYVTTDDQSASLSWYKAPIRGLRPDFFSVRNMEYVWQFLIPWGALSDERAGLSFVCAAGPCQRSHSRVLVPWDLRPYFTVSDLKLPISSPLTTRRVTVEVFDPASTWVMCHLYL